MSNAANAPKAILQDEEGRSVLRFERLLRHPPERVWRALTEPGELSAWHPTPFEVEPAADGGVVRYLPEGDVPDMPDGALSEYDPPRVLAYAWGDDHLRWELRPHDDGCLLVLTHTFDDRFKAARDAAGWHLCLDALSSSLDGEAARLYAHRSGGGADSSAQAPSTPTGWRELNRGYEQRFGIPPEKATPPPGA
jgi:uncharacterized protein YndB with AHSA1/START domain